MLKMELKELRPSPFQCPVPLLGQAPRSIQEAWRKPPFQRHFQHQLPQSGLPPNTPFNTDSPETTKFQPCITGEGRGM